jgi:hypothetical protein
MTRAVGLEIDPPAVACSIPQGSVPAPAGSRAGNYIIGCAPHPLYEGAS